MRMREQRSRAAELPPAAQIAQKAGEKLEVAAKKPPGLLKLGVSDYNHKESAIYQVMRTDGTRKRQPLLIKKRM
jgi:hypothetical protein